MQKYYSQECSRSVCFARRALLIEALSGGVWLCVIVFYRPPLSRLLPCFKAGVSPTPHLLPLPFLHPYLLRPLALLPPLLSLPPLLHAGSVASRTTARSTWSSQCCTMSTRTVTSPSVRTAGPSTLLTIASDVRSCVTFVLLRKRCAFSGVNSSVLILELHCACFGLYIT